MMTIPTSDEIRILRERLGMSREEMAHAVGCSTGAIIAWEQGTRRPNALAYVRKLRLLARRADRYLHRNGEGTANHAATAHESAD